MANQPPSEELKKNLTGMQFYIMQNHGIEPLSAGRLLYNKHDGIYRCSTCDSLLFRSETKYDSGCGWLSSYEPVSDEAARYVKDTLHGMQRIEIRCGNCDAHPGHVFPDNPKPTDEQYCVSPTSLNFISGENGKQTKG